MSQFLYTDSDFSVKGPFGVDELVRQGINLETLIWQEGMEDWVPAGSVPAVRRALSAAPVASVADVQHEGFVVEAEPTEVQKVEDFVEKTDVVHVNAASDVIPPAPPVVQQKGAVASEGRRGTWGLSLLLFLLAVLLLIPIGFVVGKSFLNSKVAFSDEAYAPADSTPVEGVLGGGCYFPKQASTLAWTGRWASIRLPTWNWTDKRVRSSIQRMASPSRAASPFIAMRTTRSISSSTPTAFRTVAT